MPWLLEDGAKDAKTSQSFRHFCTLPVFTVLVLTSDHHNCSDISVLFLGLLYLYSQMSRIFPFFGGVGWGGPPLYVVCIRDRQGGRSCAKAQRAFAEKFGL